MAVKLLDRTHCTVLKTLTVVRITVPLTTTIYNGFKAKLGRLRQLI